MFPDATHRGCPHCRLHYIAHDGPDGLTYKPACTCEADATRAAEQKALVDQARGALHELKIAMAPMLRRPTEP